jgi:hypothetical protein
MGDDVQTYLAAQIEALTAGQNLFVGNTPDAIMDCVTIFDTGGGPANQDYPTDDFAIQIDVRRRASSYAAGLALAGEIFTTLNRKQNLTVGTKDVMMIAAVAPPQVVGLDEKSRWIITTNYMFHVRDYYGEE